MEHRPTKKPNGNSINVPSSRIQLFYNYEMGLKPIGSKYDSKE